MKERPIKWINGVKLIGVIDPANDRCFIPLRGERTYCADFNGRECICPFRYRSGSDGLWLTEKQALPLLLTGDAK